MQCPLEGGEGPELIVGYVASTLDPVTRAAFERHLEECARCREAAEAQQAVWSVLDEWRGEPVSPEFDQKLWQRIAEEPQATWWQRLWSRMESEAWSWRPALPVAAACAVLIAAFLLKLPEAGVTPASQGQPRLEIEQVEHALDDMDLLNQLGVEAAPQKPASGQI